MKRAGWTVFLWLLLPCLCVGEGVVLTPSKQLYDRHGIGLRGILSQNHTYYDPVPLDRISPWLISAVIAVEDKRFYTHNGIDVSAILRAAWQNTTEQEVVSGASTITQQLARVISPRPKTWLGKTQEAVHAMQLEQNYTKEEILEQYFNRLEFGNLTQGVQAASHFYFALDADQLSLSQAAFLAGIIQSPTYYNPVKYKERALKRRNYVLKQMFSRGFIDEEMYTRARKETIVLHASPRPFYAPHFTQLILPFLPEISTIFTTIDYSVQLKVEQIIKNHLAYVSDNHVTNAAVVVIENATGGVLAYAGSADFADHAHSGQVDGARALRQPGSALKPFVYGLAFEQRKLTPASLLEDTDTFFEGGFRPHNYDENFHGIVSVRAALANSYNIPAVRAAELVGVENLLDLFHQAGIRSLDKDANFYGLGLALGNGEVRLLELTNAYAALARGGITKPILLAVNPRIKIPGKTSRILDEKSAYLITDILKDNQARAAAFGLNSSLAVPFEMAAKTGTSKDYKDNFAFGYTARWTIGVWVGNFDASPMHKVSGITGAGPILHDIAVAMQAKYPSAGFNVPDGIKRLVVCNETGLLASARCMHTHEDVFDARHLPGRCTGQHQTAQSSVKIISPVAGDIFVLDPAFPRAAQQVKLSAQCGQSVCHWHINKSSLADHSCNTWWPLSVGKYSLSVECGGKTSQLSFEIIE